jgi:hypothetical protein
LSALLSEGNPPPFNVELPRTVAGHVHSSLGNAHLQLLPDYGNKTQSNGKTVA